MTDRLQRRDATAGLLRDRGDLLVISGLGSPTYDVAAAGDDPGNFYLWGAMGGAALVGLGLAHSQPGRPVVVITGDAELMMGLGGLATIAISAPSNLSIVVLDNGEFGETGGQQSHCGLGVDLVQVANAVGFRDAMIVTDRETLSSARTAVHEAAGGPRLIRVMIAPGENRRILPARDGAYLKSRIRAHLGIA